MISVCLAAYNGGRYLGEQIASILASPRVDELLVSDDGSTDDTLQRLESVGDSRLRVLAGPRRGTVANFEFLLNQVRGQYVFLSDQDDVWLAHKVDAMMSALQEVDLVVSDCSLVDERLEVVEPSFFSARRSGPGFLRNLWRNSFLGCCMAFRREVLVYALPFPRGVPMHDWWLGLMASRKGRVKFIDEVLVLYRRHGENATYAVVSQAPLLQRMRWRARMIRSLLSRS